MSLSWRDRLRIALSPDRVTAVRMTSGWRPRVIAQGVAPCAPAGPDAPLWRPAVDALARAVQEVGERPADVTVVLSNHFAHYALVPQSDDLDSEAEEIAFVRHCFAKSYGKVADDWSLRLSDAPRTELRVAAAVDEGLLDAIREAMEATRLRLRSIQPYLMCAFNRWRSQLSGPSTWFVAAEHGKLCLALLHDGKWRSVRAVRVGDAWAAELPAILTREGQLAGIPETEGEVYLFAPEFADSVLPAAGKSQVRRLTLPQQAGLSPGSDAMFAMAMSG